MIARRTLCLLAVLALAIATAAIYPLKRIAPASSLSVVYLPAVLLVSAYWGLVLGLITSLLSAAAFNFFHIPPVGQFTISDSRNWVGLIAFITVAVCVSAIAEIARSRTRECRIIFHRGNASHHPDDLRTGRYLEVMAHFPSVPFTFLFHPRFSPGVNTIVDNSTTPW